MEVINGTMRMTSDRLLLKPMEWNGEDVHGPGTKIVAIRHGNPVRGRVVAVGPGHYPVCKRTNLGDGRRRIEYSKHFRPTEVRPGDVVEFGALNANIFDGKSYPFTEVLYNGELHLICQERDVTIVRDDLKVDLHGDQFTSAEQERIAPLYEALKAKRIASVTGNG
jgi:co-chaperonin GroES (HSP10)